MAATCTLDAATSRAHRYEESPEQAFRSAARWDDLAVRIDAAAASYARAVRDRSVSDDDPLDATAKPAVQPA